MEELYETKRELGHGHQGVVTVCSHRPTGLEFACKSTRFQSPSEDAAISARDEIAALSVLRSHPNIIYLYAHFQEASAVHAILDLCHGGDLYDHIALKQRRLIDLESQRLAKHIESTSSCDTTPSCDSDAETQADGKHDFMPISTWPLSELQAAEIFAATLRAIAFCHDHGIMHRDIKIENLLIPRGGCSYQDIKLTDFGFATEFSCGGERKAVKGILGTLRYVAPEVLSQQDYDEKADIWSLGVLLFLLLCGSFPFQGNTSYEMLQAIKLPNWEKVHKWPPIPFLAKDLLKKMLHLDPSKRCNAHVLLTDPWLQKHGVAGQVSTTSKCRKHQATSSLSHSQRAHKRSTLIDRRSEVQRNKET